MNITFLIVDDVVNLIIGLDALHQIEVTSEVQFHLFQSGKADVQQRDHRAALCYFKNHYYSSGCVIQGYIQSSILQWEDPEYTVVGSQSTNQIIAEIDFEVNSELHWSNSVGEEDDSNQEANPAQGFKRPEVVSAADRKAHSLTHMPFKSWCTLCQRAKVNNTITSQSRRFQVSFSLIIVSTKFMERLTISKCSLS